MGGKKAVSAKNLLDFIQKQNPDHYDKVRGRAPEIILTLTLTLTPTLTPDPNANPNPNPNPNPHLGVSGAGVSLCDAHEQHDSLNPNPIITLSLS